MLVFRERETGVPGEKPLGARERTSNNEANPHMASSPGFEPRRSWWVKKVVTATPTLQPQKGIEKFIKLETVENVTVLTEK